MHRDWSPYVDTKGYRYFAKHAIGMSLRKLLLSDLDGDARPVCTVAYVSALIPVRLEQACKPEMLRAHCDTAVSVVATMSTLQMYHEC
ncbi:hypothetical protein INH39_27020 [Massilia violaceinigra]|uniref:Uncharacterized protein n=1 Tax=Massilia violaceinigra TaxID=2045208 RepID=A0ABY4A2Q9_9BURK|nr:hypothetical protein [Massilia violaceinigra]UOD29042.1 hypothetical protein INH39_27020 [Massilia violaceinigra]